MCFRLSSTSKESVVEKGHCNHRTLTLSVRAQAADAQLALLGVDKGDDIARAFVLHDMKIEGPVTANLSPKLLNESAL